MKSNTLEYYFKKTTTKQIILLPLNKGRDSGRIKECATVNSKFSGLDTELEAVPESTQMGILLIRKGNLGIKLATVSLYAEVTEKGELYLTCSTDP